MKTYKKSYKIRYNEQLFQIIVRSDHKLGFLKILENGKHVLPNAKEFLHLSSMMNKRNQIKF